MRSSYRELVRVVFQHEYYLSTGAAFTFAPQGRTAELLRRSGLLFRPADDGFVLLYQAVKDQHGAYLPLRRLPTQEVLRFWIYPNQPHAGTVSALPLLRPSSRFLYFDNLTDRHGGETLYLNRAAPAVKAASQEDLVELAPLSWRYSEAAAEPVCVSVQDSRGTVVWAECFRPHQGHVQGVFDPGQVEPGLLRITAGSATTTTVYRPESLPGRPPLAAVDLHVGPGVPPAYAFTDPEGLPQPKVFTCRIAKRSSIWRYVVVPRFNPTLPGNQLSIRDADSRYDFAIPVPVATMAGEAAFAIESTGPIPHQEEPIKGLALRRNNVELIRELPNPGPEQIRIEDGAFYAEVQVYV